MSLSGYREYYRTRMNHWEKIANLMSTWHGLGGHYHRRLAKIFGFLVQPGLRVLEIGCGQGDLLAELKPGYGVGVDFSHGMISQARKKHPGLRFIQANAQELPLNTKFDVVIISDLLNDLWDVQGFFTTICGLLHKRSRIIINVYSRLWEIPLAISEKMNLAKPVLNQNWVTVPDVTNLLNLAGLEVVRTWSEILWPVPTPILDKFCNQVLAKFWPFRLLDLTNFIVARSQPGGEKENVTVSVIIPARNEAGTIRNLIDRIPIMGKETEIIFIEGGSLDDTFHLIQQEIHAHPDRPCRLLKQSNTGKADAIHLGFEQASGDLLMVLDADLTVPPEELPRFFSAIVSGKGDFINGVRLVYPMEKVAMPFLNMLGNKVFSLLFSWLLGQPVKDTLCGTKVFWRSDYHSIAGFQSSWKVKDPFGDFELLFGAARLNLKIVDMPVRYQQRMYGKSKTRRWEHGWLLLKMAWVAARNLKFV